MAFFELNSDITIGKFHFSGVHEVQIKRSIHSIVETAVIKLPSIARVAGKETAADEEVITGKLFEDKQQVTIKLGYNGDMQTEFKGFVKRRNLDMPLEIVCEGYSWVLRQKPVKIFKKSTTVKELLELAVEELKGDQKISIKCDADIVLLNVHVKDMTAFDLIQYILTITDGCLTIFFIQPDVLWCGLAYTAYADGNNKMGLGAVQCRLGYNVIKKNTLKEKDVREDKVKVMYSKKLAKGELINQVSDVFQDATRKESKILNQVAKMGTLKVLANEKAYQLNYSGYEGGITAFLQPYATPGYTVSIVDSRYKDKEGTYLIESTEVTFGVKGARRIMEVGPKLGFAKEK